jgi:hypothetical protein
VFKLSQGVESARPVEAPAAALSPGLERRGPDGANEIASGNAALALSTNELQNAA